MAIKSFIAATALIVVACNTESVVSTKQSTESSQVSEETEYLASRFNVDISQVIETDSSYLIDKDIIVLKDKGTSNNQILAKPINVSLSYYPIPEAYWVAKDICLEANQATMPTSVYNILKFAVDRWNTASSTAALHFTLKTSCSNYARFIPVDFISEGCNAAEACIEIPSVYGGFGTGRSGQRQRLILSDVLYYGNPTGEQKIGEVMHVIGHALGLANSVRYNCEAVDEDGICVDPTEIPGTTTYDSQSSGSIMYPLMDRINNLSTDDKLGLSKLYPKNPMLYITNAVGDFGYYNVLIGVNQDKLLENVRTFQFQSSPYRIAALTLDGSLMVKEGAQTAEWTNQHGSVVNYQINGNRIGILQSDGTFKVKEGSLYADWMVTTNIRKFVLDGSRVAAIDKQGCLLVKDGVLGSDFSGAVNLGCNFTDVSIKGTRIGAIRSGILMTLNGTLSSSNWVSYVTPTEAGSFSKVLVNGDNTFALGTASPQKGLWWKEGDAVTLQHMAWNVKSFEVNGSRIVILHNDGTITAKDGLYADWTAVLPTGNATAIDLHGNRIDVLLNDRTVAYKQGSLNSEWVDGVGKKCTAAAYCLNAIIR